MNKCKHTWPGKRTGDSCPDCWKDKGEMKPLKDIGLTGKIDATGNGVFEATLFELGKHFDNDKINAVYVYTAAERRELVREAVSQYERFRANAAENQQEKRTRNDWVAIFLEGLGL